MENRLRITNNEFTHIEYHILYPSIKLKTAVIQEKILLYDVIIFLIAMVLLVIIARKHIAYSFLISALFLGAFTLEPKVLLAIGTRTISDISIIFLSLSVGMIPLLGGILQYTKISQKLIESATIPKKTFIGLAPALFGMIPMPGGALLSAPLLGDIEGKISKGLKVAANVWFRHALILIYPLGPLLAAAKMAKVPLYEVIYISLPFSMVLLISGYYFILKPIEGKMPGKRKPEANIILKAAAIVLTPPLLHITLTAIFPDVLNELHLIIAVTFSLFLSIVITKLKFSEVIAIIKKMRPWKYGLLILFMFFFMHIFQATKITKFIASFQLTPFMLFVVIGFLLGIITGRVRMPVALILPICFTIWDNISAFDFSLMYCSIFLGYLISPIHACIVVSLEYFKDDYLKMFYCIIKPALACLAILMAIALVHWNFIIY